MQVIQVPIKALRDRRLSNTAKVVLIYGLYKREQFEPEKAIGYLGITRYSLYKAIRELKEIGYTTCEKIKDETGRFIACDYQWFSEPQKD
jgi:biotin operon repressor